MKVAVLASTSGTDMDVLMEKNEHFTLSLVICNKKCGAYEKAQANGFRAVLLSSKDKKREDFDKEVMELLQEHRIDLVVLIGYMRLLSKHFVEHWRNKIMNIHPSLLPAFAGGMDLNVHEEVLERGCKVTGCTLHFVDEGEDTGPIIMQRAVPVTNDETPESLKEKVQLAEQAVIIEAVEKYAQGKITVEDNKVIVQ